jgi:EAL domain-containing protein (putative c-di-GMP-specific phosphodiesterase class I)
MSRILLVDDDLMLLRVIRRMLARDGHDVFTASNGTEALKIADAERLDVAIVDQHIPGMVGLTVIQHLYELQPGCVRILASGALNVPMIISAVNQGEVDRLLEKPISHRRLREVVRDGLASREKMRTRFNESIRIKRLEDHRHLIESIPKLRLALQPILTPRMELFGFECLMRSQHTVLNNPLKIIQAAEHCEMLHNVSEQVMLRAQKRHVELPPTNLFVNLHPDELLNPKALISSLEPLQPYASRTVLELTEHNQIKRNRDWETSIKELQERGFRLAIDDLGAGYNSLSVLAAVQPEFIKIDMSIVRNVDKDPYKERLLRILVQLGESTGSTVLAEGIETGEELSTVLHCGVHLIQGYHLGRPSLQADLSRYPRKRTTEAA